MYLTEAEWTVLRALATPHRKNWLEGEDLRTAEDLERYGLVWIDALEGRHRGFLRDKGRAEIKRADS